jgi:hypothetical protein
MTTRTMTVRHMCVCVCVCVCETVRAWCVNCVRVARCRRGCRRERRRGGVSRHVDGATACGTRMIVGVRVRAHVCMRLHLCDV